MLVNETDKCLPGCKFMVASLLLIACVILSTAPSYQISSLYFETTSGSSKMGSCRAGGLKIQIRSYPKS